MVEQMVEVTLAEDAEDWVAAIPEGEMTEPYIYIGIDETGDDHVDDCPPEKDYFPGVVVMYYLYSNEFDETVRLCEDCHAVIQEGDDLLNECVGDDREAFRYRGQTEQSYTPCVTSTVCCEVCGQ